MAIINETYKGVIPTDLDAAVLLLKSLVDPKELADFSTKDEFIGAAHHGLGRWIRNTFGLWKEEERLHLFFKEAGVKHPDDMSGCILRAFWADHVGEPFDLAKEANRLRRYYIERDGFYLDRDDTSEV